MYGWVIKIGAAAVALTVAGYTLPKGNIKKAAMLALGFLFLTVLLLPLKNFTSNIILEKAALNIEKNMLLSQTGENTAQERVMERYKERISEEIVSTLGKMSLECSSVIVSVDEDSASETFGYVLSVSCSVSRAEESSKNTIDKVKVPEIVIDLNGVRLQDGNDTPSEQEAQRKESMKQAAAAIAELTGAAEDRINVKWSEKT